MGDEAVNVWFEGEVRVEGDLQFNFCSKLKQFETKNALECISSTQSQVTNIIKGINRYKSEEIIFIPYK